MGYTDTKDALLFEVPSEDISKLQDVSSQYWFRFSFHYPEEVNIADMRQSDMQLSAVKENSNDFILKTYIRNF